MRIDVAPHGETSAILYPSEEAARTSARLTAGPSPSGSALILAHGAGAGQRSPFLIGFARAIAALGFDVVTFDFLYMERHRRMPDRSPVLEACYSAVITAVRDLAEEADLHDLAIDDAVDLDPVPFLDRAVRQVPLRDDRVDGYPLTDLDHDR